MYDRMAYSSVTCKYRLTNKISCDVTVMWSSLSVIMAAGNNNHHVTVDDTFLSLMLMCVLCSVYSFKVEKAWAMFKSENGINYRCADYEKKHQELLGKEFPEIWNSYRHFEATRNVFNTASRLSIMRDFRAICQVSCNFLHSELSHDTTLFAMKEAYQIASNAFGPMVFAEKQAVALELMLSAVIWLNSQLSIQLILTIP